MMIVKGSCGHTIKGVEMVDSSAPEEFVHHSDFPCPDCCSHTTYTNTPMTTTGSPGWTGTGPFISGIRKAREEEMLEKDEFLRSMEERIKDLQEDLQKYEELKVYNLADMTLAQIRLLHAVKADYVLKR